MEWVRKVVIEPFDILSTGNFSLNLGYLLKELSNNRGCVLILSLCHEYSRQSIYKITDSEYTIDEVLMKNIIEKYKIWIESADKAMIWDVDKIKPFLDGKELIKIFEVEQGRIAKHLLNNQFTWQLMNPTKTKEDYQEYVKANRENILKDLLSKK